MQFKYSDSSLILYTSNLLEMNENVLYRSPQQFDKRDTRKPLSLLVSCHALHFLSSHSEPAAAASWLWGLWTSQVGGV